MISDNGCCELVLDGEYPNRNRNNRLDNINRRTISACFDYRAAAAGCVETLKLGSRRLLLELGSEATVETCYIEVQDGEYPNRDRNNRLDNINRRTISACFDYRAAAAGFRWN